VNIQSQRARDIDAYIAAHPDAEIGRWPVEIAGQKKILPFYRLPLTLLRYNAKNGRLAMERQQWEKDNGRDLDSCQPGDAEVIRGMLLDLDRDKTEVLKEDLRQKGQMEPGVITNDGFVINGNRRMAILELLHKEEPTGKWEFLEAVRLPTTISQKDLWKIEAGLQLSKDKIAEYHPVNELLKIKQGIDAGLSPDEVAAAMYGRTVDEVTEALKRLELIDNFLKFCGQPGNYGLIKKFGLHEYFIDIQKHIIPLWDRKGLPKRQCAEQLQYAFALIRASFHVQDASGGRKTRGITHWDFRDLGKIFYDVDAQSAFLEQLGTAKNLHSVPAKTVIEDFRIAQDILGMREQRDQPVRLIEKAIKALESIDRKSKHFYEERVKEAVTRLSKVVQGIERELAQQPPAKNSK
jgi:hypothetical protein